ncbi:T9SS type A sorting domain-containing protein [Aurantibacillus circumpalustris]|uniref:T9SS type A sorting domain-containing protein n=1 Tax=Aurantibacillus circumpalustris TaxID=3036359 RepID=UPI00295AFE6A|nr:T9SS type A sorting domain-containing protein [Aurantibacillus circumpalustris]
MIKITKLTLCFCLGMILCFKMKSQLSGTYNIPTNYPSLSAAISDLNVQGVSGPVFIEITSGYTETAPVGGYSLTATGTALNQITFRKIGVGANPLITSYVGGTGTPATATQDGVWRLIGSDYITIDGIDISDPNTTNPSTMEYGYGLFRASTTDGCQNNTIKNCVINLRTINNVSGSGSAVDGSRGINLVNSLANSQTIVLAPISFAGTNSNNRFYANTIRNCNVGIALIGYAAPSPFTLADSGNDIGGLSSLQGNNIMNFGGAVAATNPAAGVRTLAQYNLNVSYNTFNNNDGSGVNHTNALRGIYVNAATSANVTITNNTLTLNGGSGNSQVSVIENLSGATAANNTITIIGNTLLNCGNALNTTGSFFGIYNNGASASYLDLTGNTFSTVATKATTGTNYLIYNTGAIANTIKIDNNLIANCTNSASTTGFYYSIYNNVISAAALSMSSNTFSNNVTNASTGSTYLIYNASATSNNITLNNNTITNCANSITSTGAFYGIYNNGASTANLGISGNSFLNHQVNSFSGSTYLIYNTASISGGITMNTNLVSNCTHSVTSSGSLFGIYNNASSSTTLEINDNIFSSNTAAVVNGSVHLVFNRGSSTNTFVSTSMSNNLISNCNFTATSNGPFLGIYNNGVTSDNLSLSNNTLTLNAWSSTTSLKYLIYNTGSVNTILNLNNNVISSWTNTNNTTGSFNGIYNTGSVTSALNMCNNTFSAISNDATSGSTYLMYNTGALAGGVITMTSNIFASILNSANTSGFFYGIYNSGTTFSDLKITNNTFTNNVVNSATGVTNLIYNTGAISTSINSINLSNNLISNCTTSVSSNGTFYGIYNNSASCLTLTINNNSFLNNASYANNGQSYFMYNRGSAANTFVAIHMSNNIISNCINSSATGTFYSIWNNGVTSNITSILSNTITNNDWNSTTGTRYLISNWGVALNSTNISNNLIANCTNTSGTTGFLYGIYNNNNTSVSSTSLIISNNTFTNNASAATTGETHFINSSGLSNNTFTSIEISNNLISGCTSTVSAGGAFYGIYNNTASADNITISQNTFTNSVLTSSTGSTFLIYNRGAGANVFTSATYSANVIASVTLANNSSGAFYGIFNSGAAATTASLLSIKNNSFTNMVSLSTTGAINIIYNNCPVSNSISITDNYITNFTNTLSTSGTFYGIINSGASSAGDITIQDNKFLNLISTASSGARYLIYNNGAISNSIVIGNNLISNCSHSISLNGSLYGMYNNSSVSAVLASINNNTLTNNFSLSNNGNTYLLVNSGTLTNTLATVGISGNVIDNYTCNATSGNFYGIYNAGYTSVDLSIVTNTLSHITLTSTSTSQQGIYNSGRITNAILIKNNLVDGYTNRSNAAGSFYGITNVASFANSNFPDNLAIEDNRFLNTDINSTSGSIYFVNNTGVNTNTINSLSIKNNLVSNSNYSISLNGSWFGIYNTSIASGSLSLSSNTLANVQANSATSSRYMVYNGGSIINSANLSNNSVTGFTNTNNTSGTYYGINNGGNSQGDVTIANNKLVNIQLSSTTGAAYGLYNTGNIINTLQINTNLISNLTHSSTSSGVFSAVYNNNVPVGALNVSANTFTNISLYSLNGSSYLIYNRAAASTTVGVVNINSNNIGAFGFEANSGSYGTIYNSGISFGSMSVTSNTLMNCIYTTTTGSRYFVYNTGAGSNLNVSNNLVSGLTSTLNTTGSYYGINNGGGVDGLIASGNTFLNHTLTATSGSVFIIYNTSATNSLITFGNNVVSNFSYDATGSGGFLGLYNSAAPTLSLSINSNTLTTLSLNTLNGATHFVYNRGANGSLINEISFANNKISSINYTATSGSFYGLFNNNNSFANLNISGNFISNFICNTVTSPRYHIFNNGNGSGDINVNSNLVSNYTSSLSTTGVFYDLLNTGNSGSNLSVTGNTFSAQLLATTTGSTFGIYNSGLITGSVNINNNLLSQLNHSCTTGVLFSLYNNGTTCSNLSMSGNTLSTISTNNSSGSKFQVYNTSSASNSIRLNNNSITNYSASLNTSGDFAGIFNQGNSQGSFDASGNFLTNFIFPASTGTCYGIFNGGTVATIAAINNNQASGVSYVSTDVGTFYGVCNLASTSSSLSVSGNTINNTAVSVPSVALNIIYNSGTSTTLINSISMNNNSITNFTNTIGAVDFYGIHNTCPASGLLSLDGNVFGNNVSGASTANTHLIYNSAAVTNSISMSNNSLSAGFNNSVSGYSGNLYSIHNIGGAASTTLSMNGNNFSSYFFSGMVGAGNIYFIHNTNNNARYDINNNTWSNLLLNHNGNEYLIYNPSNTSAELNVNSNSVSGYTRSATAASFYGYYSNGSSPAACSQLISGNNFSNIVAATLGTGSFYGIFNIDGTGTLFPKKTISNNSISNVNYQGLGFFYGYYLDLMGDNSIVGSSVNTNTLSSVSWGGPLYGIYVGPSVSSGIAASVYGNTIRNLNTSGTTADVSGAYLSAAGYGLNFYKNKISDITSGGILGTANGVRVPTTTTISINNNLIGNINTPVSSAANSVNGINILGGTRANVFYNTVNLNTSSTGTVFSSSALYVSSGVQIDVRNNIFINTSTPSGIGNSVAFRRSFSSLVNYLNSSNNNIFYTGIPAPNRLIYADASTVNQTLPAFQVLVAPRESASVFENTSFLSTIGTSTNFLHIDPAIPSLSESGAVNVLTIFDDVDSDVRQGNVGYSGTGTAPDIGADEYNQSLLSCTSANAGSVIVASSTIQCEGETFYLLSTGFTAAGDIVHQWKVSTNSGGPYSNVAGGIGANTTAYTTSTLSAGNYYFVLVTTCTLGSISGTSNEVTVTVNATPSASASVLSQTICSGEDLVLSSNSNIGTSYLWQGPNNFTSTLQNPTITLGGTNASGLYTLIVADVNCTSLPVFVSTTVYPTPPAFSISLASSTICIGNSQTLTASLPITNPTLTFGSQSNVNQTSGYPAPYSLYYGGQKMQMLILAGELAAAGFTTGTPIQSIQFPVSSLGSNWGASINDCKNFMVGMKSTTVSALSVFEAGVSNVVSPSNFTPSIGYANTHSFSAPFVWDGISNLIVETVFSNSLIGTSANAVIQYNSPTGFLSTLVYRADNQSVSTIAAATTSNVNFGFVRPDFKLNGTQIGTYSWSPSNSLSAGSGVSVIASPTTTSIYSVTLSDGQCASSSTTSVEVILNPTITISTTSSLVCLGNTATLTANGATTYTWSTISTNTSIVISPFVSTTYAVYGSNVACPTSSTSIFITHGPALAITTLASPAVLCQSGSSTLSASGASSYTWTGGVNAASVVVSPTSTTIYTVAATTGPGCWTTKLVNVKVNPLPTISITPSAATICVGESTTFEASGVFSFTWTPGSSNSPIIVVSPTSQEVFTVTGSDLNNCLNTSTASVLVNECVGLTNVLNSDKGLRLFPNPSSGIVNLSMELDGEKDIHVLNSIGALIYQTKTTGELKMIDLSSVTKGIYFIYIKIQESTSVYKLIID